VHQLRASMNRKSRIYLCAGAMNCFRCAVLLLISAASSSSQNTDWLHNCSASFVRAILVIVRGAHLEAKRLKSELTRDGFPR
jgi:hypothetical protein